MKYFVAHTPMYGGMGLTSQGAAVNMRSQEIIQLIKQKGAILLNTYPNGFSLFSHIDDYLQLPENILEVSMRTVNFPEIPERILSGPGSAKRISAIPAKTIEVPFFLDGNPVYLDRPLPTQHCVQRGEEVMFNGTFDECQVELYKIYSELDTHRDITYSKDNCAVIEDGVVVASIKSSQ